MVSEDKKRHMSDLCDLSMVDTNYMATHTQ